MSKIFISVQNKKTLRFAIVEDDGISCWLYLTNPNENKPIADCWLYNRIEAPEKNKIKQYKDGPPPAVKDFVQPEALIENPYEDDIEIIWSMDGNSVAVLYKELPLGYIKCNLQNGFSRNLVSNGPWGHVYEDEDFKNTFCN